MKNLLVYGFILALLSCSTDRSNNETADREADKTGEINSRSQNGASTDANTVSDQDIESFRAVSADVANQVINGYLKIKDALVSSNVEEAKEAAEAVQQDLKSAEGEGINTILEDIEHIASTESLEHQREHFNDLSRNVYALTKASDATNKKLYKQHCSMAFDNTGAFWLSSSEEIRNPYFGERMLKCGRVQETI
jgi:polyhydroxyalkanoate synthesis regulator phasin